MQGSSIIMNEARQQFTEIYRQHAWGGISKSGPGSDPAVLRPYLDILQELVRELRVKSVVDVGCGDWALARTVDWSGVSYIGVDIVPDLVDALNRNYGSENIRFVCADLAANELPSADLCVIKDVLQHLSHAAVHRFLSQLKARYRYALITNDITHDEQASWRRLWKTFRVAANIDIPDGGYRPLKVREQPFNLRARCLATLPLEFPRLVFNSPGKVFETKEVLLWTREE